ncbi:hypothetical protein JQ599_24755 [Bradyrhizobium diazoefficiens]|nr:hypothetical protein [Bradyrhizobium diazoefficiens]MBR0703135.1 hypothetical protein [Bradyrhizobium diazoefficiens]MBR0771891.1 hypothetical protein [Bradyrhizobium diazoefficiens]
MTSMRFLYVDPRGREHWFDEEPASVPSLTVWDEDDGFEITATHNRRVEQHLFDADTRGRGRACIAVEHVQVPPRGKGWEFVRQSGLSSFWRRTRRKQRSRGSP